MEHPQVVLRCVSHIQPTVFHRSVLRISERDAVSPAVAPCGIRGGSRRHTALTGLSSSQHCPSGKDLRQYLHTNGEIWGKGEQIKQNRKLRYNWYTLYYFRCTMWWLNICIWQSFSEFSEIPHFVDRDSSSNWPNSGACIHWWSWVSRNFKSLYPWTFRIF